MGLKPFSPPIISGGLKPFRPPIISEGSKAQPVRSCLSIVRAQLRLPTAIGSASVCVHGSGLDERRSCASGSLYQWRRITRVVSGLQTVPVHGRKPTSLHQHSPSTFRESHRVGARHTAWLIWTVFLFSCTYLSQKAYVYIDRKPTSVINLVHRQRCAVSTAAETRPCRPLSLECPT